MKRYVLLTDSNHFPLLGASASLSGCNNDSKDLISNLLQGPWQRSGFDECFLLSEELNDADNVREHLIKIVDQMVGGDEFIFGNSSHGTHFLDYITGEKMSCTVCRNSTWDVPRSFLSKLDYQRAFQNLKPGVKVWAFFDSCESGNIGENFRLIDTPMPEGRSNRFLIPPQEVLEVIESLPLHVGRALPQEVCTMAGCLETGTCADVGGEHPHGLFSATRNVVLLAQPGLSWNALGAAINAEFAKTNEEQRCVPNGPDIPFDATN